MFQACELLFNNGTPLMSPNRYKPIIKKKRPIAAIDQVDTLKKVTNISFLVTPA